MNLTVNFSQLGSWMSDLFTNIGNFFINLFNIIGSSLIVLVYRVLIVPCFFIMDGIQMLFRKFAGLDTYYVDGEAVGGDIVLTLFNNQTVQNVFWALVILSAVLLIIITIIALIKSESLASNDKTKKSKSAIFSSSLRALVNFFMVPVVAILGIFMGNALLKSLDGATNQGEITQASVMVFMACSGEANRARLSETFRDDLYGTNGKDGVNNMGVIQSSTKEGIADAIDQAFRKSASFTPQKFDFDSLEGLGDKAWTTDPSSYYVYALVINNKTFSSFSIYEPEQVYYYYDLAHFNFLLAAISCVCIIWILLTTSISLIKRIFELVILLCISPVVCSVMPLNDKPFSQWKGQFISTVLMAYSVIVSLNLMMMLFGPIQSIDLFGSADGAVAGALGSMGINSLLQTLIICAGFVFMKDFIGLLNSLFDIKENPIDTGSKTAAAMASGAGRIAGATVGLGGSVINGAKAVGARFSKKHLEAERNYKIKEAEVKKAEKELKKDPLNYEKQEVLSNRKKDLNNSKKNFDKVKSEGVDRYNDLAKKRLQQFDKNVFGIGKNFGGGYNGPKIDKQKSDDNFADSQPSKNWANINDQSIKGAQKIQDKKDNKLEKNLKSKKSKKHINNLVDAEDFSSSNKLSDNNVGDYSSSWTSEDSTKNDDDKK